MALSGRLPAAVALMALLLVVVTSGRAAAEETAEAPTPTVEIAEASLASTDEGKIVAPAEAAAAEASQQQPVGGEVAASAEDAQSLTEGLAQARADLEAALANVTGTPQVRLRGAAGWGHGIFGETCCMCARQLGFLTVLYAAADYSQFLGSHNAAWWCDLECEGKCLLQGGHRFGCYDEQHLLQMDAMYGHRTGYRILHDNHFGNIC